MCNPLSVMLPCPPVSQHKHFHCNNCSDLECILRLQYHHLLGSKEKSTSVDSKINAHPITDIFQKYCRLSSFIFYVSFPLWAKYQQGCFCSMMDLSGTKDLLSWLSYKHSRALSSHLVVQGTFFVLPLKAGKLKKRRGGEERAFTASLQEMWEETTRGVELWKTLPFRPERFLTHTHFSP